MPHHVARQFGLGQKGAVAVGRFGGAVVCGVVTVVAGLSACSPGPDMALRAVPMTAAAVLPVQEDGPVVPTVPRALGVGVAPSPALGSREDTDDRARVSDAADDGNDEARWAVAAGAGRRGEDARAGGGVRPGGAGPAGGEPSGGNTGDHPAGQEGHGGEPGAGDVPGEQDVEDVEDAEDAEDGFLIGDDLEDPWPGWDGTLPGWDDDFDWVLDPAPGDLPGDEATLRDARGALLSAYDMCFFLEGDPCGVVALFDGEHDPDTGFLMPAGDVDRFAWPTLVDDAGTPALRWDFGPVTVARYPYDGEPVTMRTAHVVGYAALDGSQPRVVVSPA